MPQAYQATTIDKFQGLRITDVLNNAALDDDEASICDNFNLTDKQTLTKRKGWAVRNGAIVPTIKAPAGVLSFFTPIAIRILAIQRRSPTGSSPARLWFTDVNQSNLWCADLPNLTNVTIVQTGTPAAITGIEWILELGTPSSPYEMKGCSTNFNTFGITAATPPVVGVSGTSPNGTHLTSFKDRLFMINSVHSSGQESRLYYSDSAIPPASGTGTWPANNFIDILPGSGEFCVATVVFNDQLIIFKNRSTWVLNADGQPTSWVLRNLHPTIGCIGRGTPIIINGFIYFLAQDGVYRTDGTTFERISEPVDAYMQGFSTTNSASVLIRDAFFWDDKYILMLPAVTGLNCTPLVYDTRVGVWTRWVNGGSPQLDFYGGVVYADIIPQKLYVGSRLTNAVFSMGDPVYQDNGGNYICTWRSKRFTWGDPTKYKRNFMFMCDVGYTTSEPQNITATHSVDNVSVSQPHAPAVVGTTAVSTWDLARKELKFKGAGYARAMFTEVEYNGNQKFDLFSVSWLNAVKDTVKTSN